MIWSQYFFFPIYWTNYVSKLVRILSKSTRKWWCVSGHSPRPHIVYIVHKSLFGNTGLAKIVAFAVLRQTTLNKSMHKWDITNMTHDVTKSLGNDFFCDHKKKIVFSPLEKRHTRSLYYTSNKAICLKL